ncbi:MAG TPA: prolipoprotein diacylglyceryl transferase [Symbiobacteriaceae bacterium]|nr:prolipoprotein diacylglyceryl transferase [Symbiobacteriaceae bacterium]
MHPILFYVGTFPVRAYSLAILTAVVASSGFAAWLGRRRQVDWSDQYLDFALWAMAGGVLGARLWEVAVNWPYYRTVPREIYAIWEGGLSIQGAVLGGLTAAWVFTRINRIPLGRFLDESTPALLLGQAIGRLFGCTLNGDAYGKPTGTGFGITHAPGTNAYMAHGPTPLWPAEAFEGIFDLVLMAVLLRLGSNKKGTPGQHFALYAALYSAGRFALEFLRGDTRPVLVGLTAAQVGSLAVIMVSGLMLSRNLLIGRTIQRPQ